jgi:hypothetical protein
VILRVTIVVKKMMVVMKHDWVLLQQLPYDCSNFTTNEFRQDPSGRWYDHKSNSSGLVSLGLIFFSCLFLIMF